MIVITVARKPVVGTVAANAQKYGTGGLNIDACRIGVSSDHPNRALDPKASANGSVYSGRQKNDTVFNGGSKAVEPTSLGRWPANLILQHLLSCERTGIKQVKGSPTSKTHHAAYDGESTTGMLRGVSHPGNQHSDPETGLETIESWVCAPDCPVAHMDEQTGTLKSGQVKPGTRRNNETQPSNGGFNGKFGDSELTGFGDEGGASRFFKQVKGT